MDVPKLDLRRPEMLRALRELAESAARVGGGIARDCFCGELDVRLKADRSEVTDADEAAQAAVIDCLRRQRPSDSVIAEERIPGERETGGACHDRVCWVIDPIDGTRNFVRRIPLYACSVAAVVEGVPLVGAVYDPQRDMLHSAARGGGLFVNGQPWKREGDTRARGANRKPVVAVPSSPTGPTRAITQRWLDRFVCRNLGSTSLHLALVASGELDAMLADNPRLWDLAAGWVLVGEAGGKMTDLHGEPRFPIEIGTYADEELPTIAAKADVYDQLLGV